MTSEADLDSEIKALSVLSEHPILYEDFSKLGCAASLVSLLSHENTDIAIDAIQTISELTDEDVEAEQAQWDSLVKAMVCRPCVTIRILTPPVGCRCDRIVSTKSLPTRPGK
jgi:beta-catenin-like protein 1